MAEEAHSLSPQSGSGGGSSLSVSTVWVWQRQLTLCLDSLGMAVYSTKNSTKVPLTVTVLPLGTIRSTIEPTRKYRWVLSQVPLGTVTGTVKYCTSEVPLGTTDVLI